MMFFRHAGDEGIRLYNFDFVFMYPISNFHKYPIENKEQI